MGQSKSVKKKKTKIGKNKKDDKKSDKKKPPLPVDKRAEAELNLREMIREAHRIHKDHVLRSGSNNLTPISSKVLRRNDEKRKSSISSSHDEGSVPIESTKKRSKTKNLGISSAAEDVPEKSRRRDFVESKVRRKVSEESRKKLPLTVGRSSEACAMRNREIIAHRWSSDNFPVKESKNNKAIEREQGECDAKIKAYNVGTTPFVSLVLVDKMKCPDGEEGGGARKRLPRRKHQRERDYSGTISTKTRKKKNKNKIEIKEDCVTNKIGERSDTADTGSIRKSHSKKRNPNKCENEGSELTQISGESPCKKTVNTKLEEKSAVSSPTCDSSNFDNNLSTFSGAGDPFSSNTSHSYFSSNSDTSKIDMKFMEILKTVTQKNLSIDLGVKLCQKSFNTEESKHGVSSDDDGLQEFKQRELEQKLIKRINTLERKLAITNPNTENTKKENQEQEELGDSVDAPNAASPVVEQLWIKESTLQKNYSGVSLVSNIDQTRKENQEIKSSGELKKELALDVRKTGKSYDDCIKDVDDRNDKYERKEAQNLVPKVPESNPKEGHTETTAKSESKAEEEVVNKNASTSGVKQKSVSLTKERVRTPNADLRRGPGQSESVGTRSIIKRLEKAFQTLGFNLKDLESSDKSSSAKKKQSLMKNCTSFGKDKKNCHRMQVIKRVQNVDKSSIGKKKSKNEDNLDGRNCIQYKVESNGSGDKNTDYKRTRSYNKVEDLKGECSPMQNKGIKVMYSRPYDLKQDGNEEVTTGLSKSVQAIHPERYSERKISQNVIHSGITHMIVNKALTGGMTVDLGEKSTLEDEKRLKSIHVDDLLLGRSSAKRKIEYPLSASCSLSSLSEDDDFKRHKRKKKIPSYSTESNISNQDVRKISSNGTGDATNQAALQLLGRSIDWQPRKSRQHQPLKITDHELPDVQGIFHIEERNNELELKQIRERHKQIISEIQTSLDEIKKQHNLFDQLKTETRRFHNDCHLKRKRILAYLKDVEQTCSERRRERFCDTTREYRRALSTDNYPKSTRMRGKLLNKISDFELDVMSLKKDDTEISEKELRVDPLFGNNRCESVLSVTAAMDKTSSDVEISSFDIENTSADDSSSDTAESFRTVETSVKHHRSRHIAGRRKIPQRSPLEGRKMMEDPAWHVGSIEHIPQNFVEFVQELNRIILSKNDKLDDMIVKASENSNNSFANFGKKKAPAPSNTSGPNASTQPIDRAEDDSKSNLTSHKSNSSNSAGKGGWKLHKSKSKGSKKHVRDKSADSDGDGKIHSTKSGTFFQADPGGSSKDSIVNREQEIAVSESFANQIETDLDGQRFPSCSHVAKHEEHRYRKGDPSFPARRNLLETNDEDCKHCRRSTPEDERAYRRKLELERILRTEEKTYKRHPHPTRDSDRHALDYDTHSGAAKVKPHDFSRYFQPSIIIDHNRGEENEESQTVLGHASIHSGVGRSSRKLPHEYLKTDKKSGIHYLTKYRLWYPTKKKPHEGVPVNYFDISVKKQESPAVISRDVCCQTDNDYEFDDIGDISQWDDTGSTHSTTRTAE